MQEITWPSEVWRELMEEWERLRQIEWRARFLPERYRAEAMAETAEALAACQEEVCAIKADMASELFAWMRLAMDGAGDVRAVFVEWMRSLGFVQESDLAEQLYPLAEAVANVEIRRKAAWR